MPQFAGQEKTNHANRLKLMQQLARKQVLERKNELGLILDLISSCLDIDPKKRPTIPGMLKSPLFMMDNYELTKAVRFSQNVIIYRSPESTISLQITAPLRAMCATAIKYPDRLITIEEDILKLFIATEFTLEHISNMPIDEINETLDPKQKRMLFMENKTEYLKGKDYSKLRVSPNAPLAA